MPENEHLTRLRTDYAFSKGKGPNYLVMTTQEAVWEALLEIERLKTKLETCQLQKTKPRR